MWIITWIIVANCYTSYTDSLVVDEFGRVEHNLSMYSYCDSIQHSKEFSVKDSANAFYFRAWSAALNPVKNGQKVITVRKNY